VRGQQHGGLFQVGQPVHQVVELAPRRGVEAGGRLVQEQQLGAAHDADRDVEPPPLPAGQDRARNPSSISIVVVLPAPFGPSMATTSPVRTQKSMPARTSLVPYRIRRSRTSATTSDISYGR
jgi:hypothetical protein